MTYITSMDDCPTGVFCRRIVDEFDSNREVKIGFMRIATTKAFMPDPDEDLWERYGKLSLNNIFNAVILRSYCIGYITILKIGLGHVGGYHEIQSAGIESLDIMICKALLTAEWEEVADFRKLVESMDKQLERAQTFFNYQMVANRIFYRTDLVSQMPYHEPLVSKNIRSESEAVSSFGYSVGESAFSKAMQIREQIADYSSVSHKLRLLFLLTNRQMVMMRNLLLGLDLDTDEFQAEDSKFYPSEEPRESQPRSSILWTP